MHKKEKKILILPYDSNWLRLFKVESKNIKKAININLVSIHHVGSTSIPGMDAKPIIDIIVEVRNINFDHLDLVNIGYEFRGAFNIPLRKSFTSRSNEININLHIFEENDPEIEVNLIFRDYLKNNDFDAKNYIKLKYDLLKDETNHEKNKKILRGYTLGKNDFIQQILIKAGFNKYRFVIPTHDSEWREYHRIKSYQIFTPLNLTYNPNHSSFTDTSHYHFVLYKGVNIVSIAHIEFLNNSEAVIRALATYEMNQKQGYAKYLINLLEKWIKYNNIKIIKLHTNPSAEIFYKKLGYDNIEFSDNSINPNSISLGKII